MMLYVSIAEESNYAYLHTVPWMLRFYVNTLTVKLRTKLPV